MRQGSKNVRLLVDGQQSSRPSCNPTRANRPSSLHPFAIACRSPALPSASALTGWAESDRADVGHGNGSFAKKCALPEIHDHSSQQLVIRFNGGVGFTDELLHAMFKDADAGDHTRIMGHKNNRFTFGFEFFHGI